MYARFRATAILGVLLAICVNTGVAFQSGSGDVFVVIVEPHPYAPGSDLFDVTLARPEKREQPNYWIHVTLCERGTAKKDDRVTIVEVSARCKRLKKVFELQTCSQSDPSLDAWNKRFMARVYQEWLSSAKDIANGKSLDCSASFTVKSGPMRITNPSLNCYPPVDFSVQDGMRRFLFGLPISDYPFPSGTMEGSEVAKSVTFQVGSQDRYQRGQFQDTRTTIKWPDKPVN
jgi:hypothetical protein